MLNDVTPPMQPRPKTKTIEPLPKPEALPLHEQALAEDPSFKTPEESALEQSVISPQIVTHQTDQKWWHKLHWPRTRRAQILCGLAAVLLAFGIGYGWTKLHDKPPAVAATPKVAKKVVVPPKIIYSTLSGLPVADESVNQRPIVGVMVENSPDARPQSGIDKASVVFEAIAEGGITRFLTLFQDTQPDYIGPVRSVRPYYLEWGMGFDMAIAHVGGSPEALQDIRTWGVKDLDQFANGGSYSRIGSRVAPHNVYTSLDRLTGLATSKGFGAASYTSLPRKTEQAYKAPAAATNPATKTSSGTDTRTPASSINIAMSGALYDSHYDYDAVSNSYKRSEGGAPHMELNQDGSQVQIAPKVVVALAMQYGIQSDGKHSDYNVIGSGTAYIFQDGTVTPATWNKPSDKEQIKLLDAAGAPIKLNPGQTWFAAVSGTNKVTYK